MCKRDVLFFGNNRRQEEGSIDRADKQPLVAA
jgi:hypothetical protein